MARADLELWLSLIDRSIEGTSILNLVWRLPSLIHFTDASGYGISGYSLFLGQTWNFSLPSGILEVTTINHLEFLAFLVHFLLLEFENKLYLEYILF